MKNRCSLLVFIFSTLFVHAQDFRFGMGMMQFQPQRRDCFLSVSDYCPVPQKIEFTQLPSRVNVYTFQLLTREHIDEKGFYHSCKFAEMGIGKSSFYFSSGIEFGYEQKLRKIWNELFPFKKALRLPTTTFGRFSNADRGASVRFGISTDCDFLSYTLQPLDNVTNAVYVNGTAFPLGFWRVSIHKSLVNIIPSAGLALPLGKNGEIRFLVRWNLTSLCSERILFKGDERIALGPDDNDDDDYCTTTVKSSGKPGQFLRNDSGQFITGQFFRVAPISFSIEFVCFKRKTKSDFYDE